MKPRLTRANNPSSGREVLDIAAVQKFDIAFLDIYMPDMTGMEALAALRHKGDDTFTVIMSGKGGQELKVLAKKLGAYEYVTKPFTAAEVRDVIDSYVKRKTTYSALVVDDSQTIRKIIGRVLQDTPFNFIIKEAEDGWEALEYCRTHPYDMVFLDFNMPNLDGLETLGILKERNPETRVIMVSGQGTVDVVRQANQVGLDGFLAKPFKHQDATRIISRVLGIPETSLDQI
jgi:DNA-binding NtrC family response regulator